MATLIYDGECGLCTDTAKWCRRRLPDEVAVTPSQELSDADLARMGVTREDVARAAWWIEDGRPPAEGADAIARSLLAMRGRPALVGRVVSLPIVNPISKLAYRWVADNRPTVSRWMRRIIGRSRSAA